MADHFYRHNTADKDKKLAAETIDLPGIGECLLLRVVVENPDEFPGGGGSGDGDGAILDGVSTAIRATVADLTNSNPLATMIVDGAGTQITSFGGGTQYTEGDTDATITGTVMMMETSGNALIPAFGTSASGLLVTLGENNEMVLRGTDPTFGESLISAVDTSGGLGTSFALSVQPAGVVQVSGTVSISGDTTLAELPAPATAADNTTNPSISKIGSYGMIFDGSTWDRMPGNSVDGTLVNLGANNDVVVNGVLTAAALADNTANPTIGGLATFPMVFDGSNWDRLRGNPADGLTVNLGTNNDVTVTGSTQVLGNDSIFGAQPISAVDISGGSGLAFALVTTISGTVIISETSLTELPDPATLVDNTPNPSVSKIAAYPMLFDGTNWDRARGDSTNGLLVDLGANNDVSVSNFPATQNIADGGGSITVDVPVADLAASAPAASTVGITSATAVTAASGRKGLHLRNTSTSGQRISLAFDGNAAVLDAGITLYPDDVFDMDVASFTTGAVEAIASAASARLSVQEWT